MNRVELEETDLTVVGLAALAKWGTVILTRKGKPVIAVKSLPGSDWESISLANNPRFQALIEESRRSYREQGGLAIEEVRQELGLTTRSPRSKKSKRKDAGKRK